MEAMSALQQTGDMADASASGAKPMVAPVFRMPLFHPGTKVKLSGSEETVSHIVIRRHFLSVYLVGRESPVRPDQLEVESKLFSTARQPGPLFS
jgi:hypothetical protein